MIVAAVTSATSISLGNTTMTYEILAVLGGFALIYSAVAGGVERTWISGPIVTLHSACCSGRWVSDCSPGRKNRSCSWRWRS